MNAKQNIYLIGFSSSGKTSVGHQLARRLKKRFVDTDSLIVQTAGKEVSRIFADRGEAYFRRLEERMIASITGNERGNMVVALGGGAFENRANRERLLHSGTVVYLSCSLKELYRRLKTTKDRPLLTPNSPRGDDSPDGLKSRIRKLRDKRIRHFSEADITVSTSTKTIAQTVRNIVKKLEIHYAANQS